MQTALRVTALLLGIAVLTGNAWAQSTRPTTSPTTRPAARTDARMLDRVIPEFNAQAEPLGDVINRLREQMGAE